MYGIATKTEIRAAANGIHPTHAQRVVGLRRFTRESVGTRRRDYPDGRRPVHSNERQRRVTQTKGENAMTRKSFQQGYVSDPIHNRQGTAYVIRYRVRTADGKWKQRSETLYGGKKAVREVLQQRLREASARRPEASEMTFRDFVEAYWRPYLDRRAVKPSTRESYE